MDKVGDIIEVACGKARIVEVNSNGTFSIMYMKINGEDDCMSNFYWKRSEDSTGVHVIYKEDSWR